MGFATTATVAAMTLSLALGACGSDSVSDGAARGGTPGAVSTPSASSTPGAAEETGPEKDFDRTRFGSSTTIDNRWLPLKPGRQLVYEGETIEDDQRVPHRLVITVTDLTKVIDGVRNVVVWDRDYSAGQLVEAELAFFAQADDGNVWHFGQYPEEYEEGKFVGAPAWVHGIEGAQAGITVKAAAQPGAPSYSQGWGPAVGWSDRARVHKTAQRTCVRAGCYDGVLVTDEFSADEPGAHQLKYYAPGVGNVRVGWMGNDPTRETLELVKVVNLGAAGLAEARHEALKLEQSAYKVSKDVYGHTSPLEQSP